MPPTPVPALPPAGRAFLLLAGVVTIGGAVSAVFSEHLLTLLQSRGLDLAAAVALGALVGPSQVGARLIEMALSRRVHPLWSKRFAAPDLADQSRGTYVAPGADSRSRPKLQAASKSPSEAASFLQEIG